MTLLCGKPLGPDDSKVWRQALAMLMGLKIRNGLGEKDLAGVVETALLKLCQSAADPTRNKHNCEDCWLKVASGAAIALLKGVPRGLERPLWAGDS